jgi:hypothetical protein
MCTAEDFREKKSKRKTKRKRMNRWNAFKLACGCAHDKSACSFSPGSRQMTKGDNLGIKKFFKKSEEGSK